MSSKLLPPLVIALAIYLSFSLDKANAQITLNYSNFLVAPDITYTYKGVGGLIKTPATGPDQTWDYSNLQRDTAGDFKQTLLPESNPFYSDCRRQRLLSRFFGDAFVAPVIGHEKDDANAFSDIGYSTERVAYSLKHLTRNSKDSIILLKQNTINDGGELRAAIPYPNTYRDKWTYLRIETYHLQLSISKLGLDHAEYTEKLIIQQDRENTGWGKVRVPASSGVSAYQNCLLQKNIYTETDSFFVNGKPASKAVLAVLGVRQGGVFVFYAYNFKRRGTEQAILGFSFADASFTKVTSGIYDDTYYDIDLGNKVKMCVNGKNVDVPYAGNAANKALLQGGATLGYCPETKEGRQSQTRMPVLTKLNVYPNPSASSFVLQLPHSIENSTVSIYDATGKKMESHSGVKGSFSFGNTLPRGTYLVEIVTGNKQQKLKVVKL